MKIILILVGYDGEEGDTTWEMFKRLTDGNIYKLEELDSKESQKDLAILAMNNICRDGPAIHRTKCPRK